VGDLETVVPEYAARSNQGFLGRLILGVEVRIALPCGLLSDEGVFHRCESMS